MARMAAEFSVVSITFAAASANSVAISDFTAAMSWVLLEVSAWTDTSAVSAAEMLSPLATILVRCVSMDLEFSRVKLASMAIEPLSNSTRLYRAAMAAEFESAFAWTAVSSATKELTVVSMSATSSAFSSMAEPCACSFSLSACRWFDASRTDAI